MQRSQKEQSVAALHQGLKSAQIIVVARHNGLTVAEITDLRRKMRAAGARLRVTKNRLACIALKGTPFEAAAGLFKGPTAVAYSSDPVALAKVVLDYAKGNEKLSILGGNLMGQPLQEQDIVALTKLPSIDQLRGKLLGLIQAPATRIAGILNQPAIKVVGVLAAPAGQLTRVLKAYSQKSEAA